MLPMVASRIWWAKVQWLIRGLADVQVPALLTGLQVALADRLAGGGLGVPERPARGSCLRLTRAQPTPRSTVPAVWPSPSKASMAW